MAVIKTVQAGNPIIHIKSNNVADFSSVETERIVADLIDTMRAEDLVGMAAPQIGENVRIFVTEVRETKYRKEGTDKLRIFINPKVLSTSEKLSSGYEGCGSVALAQFFGPVERPEEIAVEAINENGETFTHTADGLLARIIQHEIDHLDGILFHEKISDMKKVMSKEEYVKTRGK
jgi:peptide deformylase